MNIVYDRRNISGSCQLTTVSFSRFRIHFSLINRKVWRLDTQMIKSQVTFLLSKQVSWLNFYSALQILGKVRQIIYERSVYVTSGNSMHSLVQKYCWPKYTYYSNWWFYDPLIDMQQSRRERLWVIFHKRRYENILLHCITQNICPTSREQLLLLDVKRKRRD